MKTIDLLSDLNNLGIALWVENSKLRYQAPKGVMTAEIKKAIATKKIEILDFLTEANKTFNTEESAIVPVTRDQDLPLSFAQQRLWFLHQLFPDSHSYNLLEAMQLKGTLNLSALEQSLSELIRRHEVLRTTFPMVEGQPIQRIASPSMVTLPVNDLQGLSTSEQTEQLQKIAIDISLKPFDLEAEPLIQFALLKMSEQEHVLLLKMHHIIYDGWSLSIFFRELSQLYQAFLQGLSSPLPELSIQYADFAVWQRQWLTGEVLDKQLNYWQKQLADPSLVLELPSDHPRPPVPTFQGNTQNSQLGQDLSQKLKQLSLESETTLFMTLLTAFFILLSRYSGQKDLIVGSPIANRNNPLLEQLMGFFANTLALRGELSGNPTFLELLARVKRTNLEAYAHQDLPFEMLVEKIQPERDLSRNPLVQVMFSLQNTPEADSSLSGLKIENIPLPIELKARFDLEVNFWETPTGLAGVWFYSTDLFDETTIARMGNHFNNLITAIVNNPQARISELSLLSPEEHNQLIDQGNQTTRDYPLDQCIHQLFEAQVERTPDGVAIVFQEQQLTYAELNSRANQLAHYLQFLGLKLEDKVGVCIERSPLMAIAILAILKAGGAYVPLDTAYPPERLAFMLEDTQCPLILTQNHLSDLLPVNNSQRLIDIESQGNSIAQHSSENIASKVTPNNLAYIIYTSGSTGTPKGTEVLHRNLMGFMFEIDYLDLKERQIWLQHSSISWDALTLEFWTPLLSGGRCVLYPGNKTTPEGLSKIISEQGVNILWLTSALFNVMIDNMPESLMDVKQIITGGEALSVEHVARALKLLPKTQIVNGYGPSECTVFTCCYPIPKQLKENLTSIPIGQPIGDRKVYLLDQNLQPVPLGVSGEIYVGGASVARGYLNQSTLTNQRFINNPFVPGDTLYKTGDLARYLPALKDTASRPEGSPLGHNGNLEYIGRIDNQVKIRGFRIELGGIETILSQHNDVKVACVIVREDTPGDKRIVAYIVPPDEIIPSISELRQFLKPKLPDYMIPSAFEVLEKLPLTPNGKIDRRSLKAPTYVLDEDRFVRARNQLEFKLAQIWSNTLKLDNVGVQDNFFYLGGHSLLVPYLMTQIKQEFGQELPLTTLFDHPTIEELAIILQEGEDNINLDSRLVAIQPKGSKTPFFCVPGIGGKPFYLYNLGHYLGQDQPFYAFQAYDTLDGESEVLTRIEDIASNYLQAMRSVQPQGPYLLGGHSFGGKVAFEMARQLHEQDQEIGLLVMLDANAPTPKEKPLLSYFQKWDNARWLMEIVETVGMAVSTDIGITYELLQNLTFEEQLKHILQQFQKINALAPNTEIKHIEKMMEVYQANNLATPVYQPQEIYPFSITLIRAEEIPEEDPDGDLFYQVYFSMSGDSTVGWNRFSTQPIKIHFVPGNHVSMMNESNIHFVAKQLKNCLEQAQIKNLSLN